MIAQPLVSIIIPSFNREALIAETLQSVLDQTYPTWECLIVDDGSIDGTKAVAQSFIEKDARFKWLERHREPKGAPTCRNIGIEKSKGEYVIFLDSDDLLYPHCIEKRTLIINKEFPDVLVSQGDISRHGEIIVNNFNKIDSSFDSEKNLSAYFKK
ncbi:glycosyltransferase [Reichenbachiella carrageenanivorans]|uniref:Glycosyltransferase n=1 Tax=Reichenbachiella carrageenanivorans TaxID=2979869 RepID=A0ABY6D4N7_9BACT|nr:glycosyltransferase family 2 protein [Reichenbachiella carrageenanivorans]UXX81111.1 glycosyltransferase [Reichenbachiella carrageenanivorans]